MEIVTLGIDLAKNLFALHGVDAAGKIVLQHPAVKRAKLLEVTASLPPCRIGMEACSGAHHWAREMIRQGHDVRLIAPKFVAPYRMSGKRGKNDAADAAAICEAVTRPAMRFVPVKTVEQQSELFLHRARQGYVEQRTGLINRIRGLLSELGIVLPQKADTIRRELAYLLEELPGHCNTVMGDAITDLERLDARIAEYDRHIALCAKTHAAARRLMQLAGIGPTTASALVATVGDGHDFASGRQFAAWLGMVPGQYSSGGKQRLGRITKAGDRYLRTLLILGARSVLQSGKKKEDVISRWTRDVEGRRGYWKAVVAMAAKNARLAWAVLHHGDDFRLYGQEVATGA
ncbi:transposase [Sterolibacterium denitrificans]|uniref:Transposase n=1 Tax=Sterolibacterium denitrificans TaxID=157592 RepID=A0A7Z7HQR7_9PROT|nr:IS110 family transposase [Sterolibacterium denitrificans]SMB25772.1 transposase [Sterolibacterium denitrificans]